MKKYILEAMKRGLMAAAGGPVILAIVYGILGATGAVESFTPGEVSMGILTVTLMAFIIAGVSVVYQIERLPLLPATLIHAVTLYLDYLLIYLLNDWLDKRFIGTFTVIFVAGYALIWCVVILSIKANTRRINRKLENKQP